MDGPPDDRPKVRWVSLVVFGVAAAAFLGYLAGRDVLAERIHLVGTVTRSWVSPSVDGGAGMWLELRSDNATMVAFTPASAYAGSDSDWLALQGRRVRMTVHDVSLVPPVTPPLWRIDDLSLVR